MISDFIFWSSFVKNISFHGTRGKNTLFLDKMREFYSAV